MPTVADPALKIQPKRGNSMALPWSSIAAFALAGFYLALSVYISSKRLLWFDEIMTLRNAALPDVASIWKVVTHADPAMPFPYILLVHTFFKWLGAGQIVARVPSAIGMAAGLLIVFDCTRRLTDGLHGLMAMSVLGCSFLPFYGYEARSYGLYFMLSASLLWVWARTGSSVRLSLAFFGLFAAGVMMHYYFVLCLVPYAIYEIFTWGQRRSSLTRLAWGILGILAALALLAPEILAERRNSPDFWSPPTFTAFRGIFAEMFPSGLFVLAVIMVWIAFASTKNGSATGRSMIETERIGWLFLLIPVAGYIAAIRVTNAFVPRYFIGMLPGVAVAFACLLWRCFQNSRLVSAGVLALLAIPAIAGEVSTARRPQSVDPFGQQTMTRQVLGLENNILADGKQFILCTNTMLHLDVQYYSQHPALYGALIRDDNDRMIPTVRLTLAMTEFYPFRVWTVEDLKRHASQAAVIQPGAEILKAMRDAGLHARIRFAEPLEVVYFD